MDLQTLLNDYNGSVLLSPGTAEWGYVDQQWYLQLPIESKGLPKHVIGTDAISNGIAFGPFMKANYRILSQPDALGNVDKALFGALLRAHIATLGVIDLDLNRRCVIEDEYTFFDPGEEGWDAAELSIPVHNQSKQIAAFVKKYGDTFLHMMVYVFVSRGHHWQDEFDSLYSRLFSACGIQKPATWAFPTNKELFRQIMHCFGIALPLEATKWCKINNRMAHPMRLRFTPHCPVAGAAQITTLYATLNEMRNEGWWSSFENKFGASILAIKNEVELINISPYEYHVASRVVTGKAKKDLSEQSIVAFKTLCQLALGYIDYLGRRHSLSNQKVITQKSGGQKPIAEAFSRACDKFGKPDTEVASMQVFITSL